MKKIIAILFVSVANICMAEQVKTFIFGQTMSLVDSQKRYLRWVDTGWHKYERQDNTPTEIWSFTFTDSPGGWELVKPYTITGDEIRYGSKIALKANGKFLGITDKSIIDPSITEVNPTSVWVIINASNINDKGVVNSGDKVYLGNLAQGPARYLSVEKGGGLAARSGTPGSSEVWTVGLL